MIHYIYVMYPGNRYKSTYIDIHHNVFLLILQIRQYKLIVVVLRFVKDKLIILIHT